jgi:hypothetical protein
MRERRAAMRHLEQAERDLMQMQLERMHFQMGGLMGYPAGAMDAARENFTKVCSALDVIDVQMMPENNWARVLFKTKKGGETFLIENDSILRKSDGRGTCYQICTPMPALEKIASAMLILNDNPNIFTFWADNHGAWTAGARWADSRWNEPGLIPPVEGM